MTMTIRRFLTALLLFFSWIFSSNAFAPLGTAIHQTHTSLAASIGSSASYEQQRQQQQTQKSHDGTDQEERGMDETTTTTLSSSLSVQEQPWMDVTPVLSPENNRGVPRYLLQPAVTSRPHQHKQRRSPLSATPSKSRNDQTWKVKQDQLWEDMHQYFQGDFDNYEQVVMDRKEGKLPREGGGHENIHCTLVPVSEDARLAAFYFDGVPQAIYRFRYYELKRVPDQAAIDTLLYTLHPDLEKELRVASMSPMDWPGIFHNFTDEPRITKLDSCEVRWSYEVDPVQHSYVPDSDESNGIHAVMVHGQALVESQMMPGQQILIKDQLSLWPDQLWIHDRGHDPKTMEFIYGNQRGVPYQLQRVCNIPRQPSSVDTMRRETMNNNLAWTLGPQFRSEKEYAQKLDGMGGPSRNASIKRPPPPLPDTKE